MPGTEQQPPDAETVRRFQDDDDESTRNEEQQDEKLQQQLDEALKATFPASDPFSLMTNGPYDSASRRDEERARNTPRD